ncbi:MAG: hypothetical protein ACREU4_07780 [Burkholderiales bacterium]
MSLAALLVAAGPPWISIEYPVNPHDSSTRDAFLLVHTFHHGTPLGTTIEGTAEGIVSGERRTTRLEFSTTSRPGVYALRRTWGTEGVWTLVIRTSRDHGDGANAIVELASSGEIASVRVPTRRQGRWTIPSEVSMDDIERGLRARAS